MPLIIIGIAIIYAIVLAWTWHNLGMISVGKKVEFIAIILLIIYIVTLITFIISKNGINYQNEQGEKMVQNVFVAIFTGINSLIVMPYIAKYLDKFQEEEIKKKEFTKKIKIILIIFAICIFFECGYLKDAQQGMLKIYQAKG